MTSGPIVAVLVVYLLALVGIGIWSGRESSSVAAYFVADKRLPAWVVAFSSNATGESAWLLLGLTGMGYAVGVHAFWVVLGEVLGVTLAWLYVAPRFKRETDELGSITVPDYLESRFGGKGNVFHVISAVVILSMAVAYTAAQMTATGKAFGSFLGMSYTGGVILGATVILFYTTVGGFKAVAYSDLIQGFLMFGGLLVMPVIAVVAGGGFTAVWSTLRTIDPSLTAIMGPNGLSVAGAMSAVGFVGVGLAFLGAPQLLVRFMSARDERTIRDGGKIAILCIVVFDVGAVMTGIGGRVLFPGLADSETILPTLALELLPQIFAGVFLVIVLAAIMSTVDSILILASSSAVRDLAQQTFGIQWSERAFARAARVTTVVLGSISLAFAFGQSRVLFWFVLFAWSGLGAAFAPPVLAALFWKETTRAGAIAGMIAGFAVSVAWILWFKAGFYDLYEMIPAFVIALATIGIVSRLTGSTNLVNNGKADGSA